MYLTSPPSKDKAEDVLKQDNSDLVLITEYLSDSEYSEIYINDSDFSFKRPVMFTGLKTRYVNIEDKTVIAAINRLFIEREYSVIDRKGNSISFQRWTRLMDFGSGIAYSINAVDEPELTYQTKLEPLKENQWYYYEEDYNEWRKHNH